MKIATKAALRKKGPTKQSRCDWVCLEIKDTKQAALHKHFFGKMLVTDALIFIPLVTNESISKGTVTLEDEYWS